MIQRVNQQHINNLNGDLKPNLHCFPTDQLADYKKLDPIKPPNADFNTLLKFKQRASSLKQPPRIAPTSRASSKRLRKGQT